MTDPIEVTATPGQAQLSTAIRDGVLAAGSVAASLGLAGVAGQLNGVAATVGLVGALGVAVFRQFKSRKKQKQLITAAIAAPNSVAVVAARVLAAVRK